MQQSLPARTVLVMLLNLLIGQLNALKDKTLTIMALISVIDGQSVNTAAIILESLIWKLGSPQSKRI
jgi:hypothetical protein